jgi:ATP-binding cassette, subfamily B, bacterial
VSSSDRVDLLKQRSTYWKLRPYLNPHWGVISLGLFCVVVFSLFSPLMAWLAGFISKALGDGNVPYLINLGLIAGGVFIGRGIFQYGQDVLMAKVAFAVILDLRKQVYAHLLKVGSAFTDKVQTGDLAYRLTEDTDRVAEVVYKIFHQFVPNVLQLFLVLGYMVWVNWQLTISYLLSPQLLPF